jgi:hypothetical protein
VVLEPFDFDLLCFPLPFVSVWLVSDVVVVLLAPVESVLESVRVEFVRDFVFLPSCSVVVVVV